MIPRLTIGGGELVAIPAVHNRSVFAERVNRACRDESTRPEAIAVELSQTAVNTVLMWLKELGVGTNPAARIPTMLGLVKSNRRIHPRYREAALRLQELHGLPLHQLPPEILRKELHYSAVELLCISTTDSMIEAIRSAVELNIPVYGVDLGEVANPEHPPLMIQDPLMAQTGLSDYVNFNEERCDAHRDAFVDGRRELVMVAQLKRLLGQHRRVLFTGGLGHWYQLRRRLLDSACAPAVGPLPPDGEQFNRVVVDPSLAIYQMDLFPGWTVAYEMVRQLPIAAPQRLMNYGELFRREFMAALAKGEPKYRENAVHYLNYLNNLCLVQPCLVPNLFMALTTAEAMFSSAFANHLAEALVTLALPWAKPEDWPNLRYISNMPADTAGSGLSVPGQRGVLRGSNQRSQSFYLDHVSKSEHAQELQLPLLDNENNSSRKNRRGSSACNWLWPPCESLMFGIAYEAANRSKRKQRSPSTEPFAGSLHNGVQVKATLRSFIRGQKQIQIKTDRPMSREAGAQARNEPTVFIFEPEISREGGRWDTFLAGNSTDLRLHTRNRAYFDQVVHQRGDAFIASVHFCAEREPCPELRPHVCEMRYLFGAVLFGQPALNPVQSALWLEESRYSACPILHRNYVPALFEYYQQKHRLKLDDDNWPASLIRIALPYAKQSVTVIAPNSFRIPPRIIREATARRINLNFTPLSEFPSEQVQSIRNQYLVRPLDVDTLEYSKEIQAAFGESPRKHLELLPAHIRAQLHLPD